MTTPDIDALLNQSLEDIPPMTEFVTPRPGIYKLKVKEAGMKLVAEKAALEMKYTILEILELKDSTLGEDCKPGDEFSQLYFFSTDKGAEFNKSKVVTLLAPVRERFNISGKAPFSELIAAYVGCDVTAIVDVRKGKTWEQDKKEYSDVVEIQLD